MQKENKYEPYSKYDIHLLFAEPRSISDQPYMLHAAFMLSCLFEAYTPDEDEEELPKLEDTWGWTIPKSILEKIVKNANEQFIYAMENSTQIDIWDRGFSIRKAKTCDKSRLNDIFDFPTEDDNYVVTQSGIMNLAGYSEESANAQNREEFSYNKSYLRKVVMVAEDDEHDGWDKLTDMEVTMYLWALYYRKYKTNDNEGFRKHFKLDLCTTPEDDQACWNAVAAIKSKPHGLYTFSARKVREWNQQHGQKSIIDSVDEKQAEDYWYDVAINTSCK